MTTADEYIEADEESQLDPIDVFTPRQPPSREMFTKRNEADLYGNPGLQDRARDALRERGGQLIMFGDAGVGKSTLLKYAAEDEGMKMISIKARSKSFDELIDMAIREVTAEREVEIVRTSGSGGGGEVGLSSHVTIKGHLKNEKGQQVRVELIEQEPLLALADTLATEGYRILAFDNFHNVKAEDRAMFAQALEVFSDIADETGDVKMVLLGIADDADSLVGSGSGSGSVRRRMIEIGVPRMPDDEISSILASGFRLLGLECEENALRDLIFYCDGFPYFAHLLGLSVARDARRRGERVIAVPALDAALANVSKQVEGTFPTRIAQAFERGGKVQPRKRILHTMCASNRREWRSGDVVEEYAKLYDLPKDKDPGFLHAALGALVLPKRGAVLTRRGPRGQYVFRFGDPYMRPYLRMQHFQPAQGRLF